MSAYSRLAKFGTRSGLSLAVTGGAALAAISSANPMTGATNLALDMAFTTPTMQGSEIDNTVLGHDIAPRMMFPGFDYLSRTPKFIQDAVSPGRTDIPFTGGISIDEMKMALNPQTASYASRLNWKGQNKKVLSAYGDNPVRRMQQQTRQSMAYASGDMVFGMYNVR